MSDSDVDDPGVPPPSKSTKSPAKKSLPPAGLGANKVKSSPELISGGIITAEELRAAAQDPDSELVLVRIPKGLPVASFHDQDLVHEFSVGGKSYQPTVDKDKRELLAVLLAGDDDAAGAACVTLSVKRVVTVSERFEAYPVPEIHIPPRYVVPQLANFKERHPIYGVDFTKDKKSIEDKRPVDDSKRNKRPVADPNEENQEPVKKKKKKKDKL